MAERVRAELLARLDALAEQRGAPAWAGRFEPVRWRASDGVELQLEVLAPPEASATVVFMPGTNAYALLYGELLAALADAGLCVVGFDPRGHGLSEGPRGDYTIAELVRDFGGVVDYARERFGLPVFAAGSSQGGIAAFYLAASDTPLAGAICHNAAELADPESVRLTRFPRVSRMFAPLLPRLARLAPRFSVPMTAYLDLAAEPVRGLGNAKAVIAADPLLVDHVSLQALASLGSEPLARPVEAITTPILLLHAGDDGIFPLDYIEALFDRLRGPKRLKVYAGLPHYMIVDYVDRFLADLLAWVDEQLVERGEIE